MSDPEYGMSDAAYESSEGSLDPYDLCYWQGMDGGRGPVESLLWIDISFILAHLFVHNHATGEDGAAGLRAVDLGCGPGLLVKTLRSRGLDAVGLDISPTALSLAPEDVQEHLRLFDAGWVDDSFYGRGFADLLVSTEVLEHIPADRTDRAVGHIWNLLKPGGVAVLTICVTGRENDNDPTHCHVVNRSFWVKKFREFGFREDEEKEGQMKEYHLFESHGGVFVLRKP